MGASLLAVAKSIYYVFVYKPVFLKLIGIFSSFESSVSCSDNETFILDSSNEGAGYYCPDSFSRILHRSFEVGDNTFIVYILWRVS